MSYTIFYTNQGKREKTRVFATEGEAQKVATFLVFQGAERIRIKECCPEHGEDHD